MKKSFALYKSAIFSYLIDPLFYASSLLTVLFCLFKFFFMGKFFVAGVGSTDLRPFFNSVPYISILTVPLLVLRLRPLLLDDSVPLSPFKRFSALSLSAFSAFAFPLILLSILPFCVNLFGTVDFFQALSSFLGIFLYGHCASLLSILFFSLFPNSQVFPLILSSVSLALVNFLHLLPLYYQTGIILTFLCRKISFAWHFDSFSKGIIDSRNIAYYLILAFVLLLLCVSLEYRRLGKKTSRRTAFLFAAIIVLVSLSFQNLYFRADASKNGQFSLSKTSKNLLSNLENPIRITYYRSKELKNLYPQTSDVAEFLADYCSEGRGMSFTLEKAEPEKLKALGIQGQQIRSDNGTKTEFVTVYSAVLIQYLEKSELIPFVLSTSSLEYDLTQRVQKLITSKDRKVYLLCGNGRSLEESYLYVAPWLSSRGFEVEHLNDFNATEVLKNLTSEDQIAVFGTKDLSAEQSFYLQNALEKGAKAFIATSPFHTTIEDEWKVSKPEHDSMISYLNGKGFAFDLSLAEDISCYPLTMESGEGNKAEYATVNYPLWLVIQNQKEAKKGATVFWASPIVPYGQVEPLLFTTNYAWKQRPAASDDGNLFLTNPFLIPKSAAASDAKNEQLIVAARSKNISLVADQFFLSSLMTGFISGESSGDFRNYDYLTKELLVLRGEGELAALMEKSAPVTALHKIVGESEFSAKRKLVLLLTFGLLPLVILSIFVFVQIKRKKK